MLYPFNGGLFLWFSLFPILTDALSTSPPLEIKRLFPFQLEGVDRLVSSRGLLLGDEMGLGKTVQSIAAINRLLASGDISDVLVVCPKSVMAVWQDELGQWLEHEVHISVATAGQKNLPEMDSNTAGLPNILLINYDICHKHRVELQSISWDVLICDEAHYLKSIDAKRTLAILGDGSGQDSGISSKYLWLLTGTPLMNRPVELYPLLRALAPEGFDSFDDYADRYCDRKSKFVGGRGVVDDVSGASNLAELSMKLEPLMLRRYKSDVLTELPPKFRSCLHLSSGDDVAIQERQRMEELSNELGIDLGAFGFAGGSLSVLLGSDHLPPSRIMGLLSSARKETALQKLLPSVALLKEVIESHKVVVFCHHRRLILDLMREFGPKKAVHIIGGMDSESRAEAVRRFQSEKSVRIFIGSIRAAGVGLTLTAASHVIFLELDWSPAVMRQAEDRCHRVGQRDSVNVQYYVFKDTIDEMLARSLVTKQMDIDQVLNADTRATQPGYVFDFGTHKGLRLEDVPRGYIKFVLRTSDIWRKRPLLWRALHGQGLVHESPPLIESEEAKPKKYERVNFLFDFGKYCGKSWDDVPLGYREWVIQEGVWRNRPLLRNALQEAGLVE